MKPSKIDIRGADGLRLETSALALEVTTGVGPRVTSFASKTGKVGNLFLEMPTDERVYADGFVLRGGHRLWHAPEHITRTYQPDNEPIAFKPVKNGLALAQPIEPKTGLQKALKIEFRGERTVRLTHALTHHGLWPIDVACWAISMFRPGGYGVLPLLPKGDHTAGDLLPAYSIVPWTYTDLAHEGWDLHREYFGIDVNAFSGAQKLGLTAYPGWSAYHLDGTTFVKHAALIPGATYPDRGCPIEVFTNGQMIELETLSPLTRLEPGQALQHVEHWTLFEGLKEPATDGHFATLRTEVTKWIETL
jgi:hypothetical protein